MGGQIVGFSVVKNAPADRVKVLEQATLNALADRSSSHGQSRPAWSLTSSG